MFSSLHQKGNPVILFNIWDAGTAKIAENSGAKVIALGSHAVAEAYGYEDGENIPLDLALENATRIVSSTELPVTLDFEAGYGSTPSEVRESVTRALQTGIIGVNIEDKKSGGDGLYTIDEQVERIKAVREAAQDFGVDLFINARTDLFKEADPADHNDKLVNMALKRAAAFANAGADGFFAPVIIRKEHMKRICDESPLPVNIIWLPGMGMPDVDEVNKLNVSRISYGPGPWLQMKEWLAEKASSAYRS